jgi:hypothetical protein
VMAQRLPRATDLDPERDAEALDELCRELGDGVMEAAYRGG